MRPAAASKFHALHERKKVVINVPRPSPARINKDSHLIRKPSSSSSTSVVPHKQQRDPIIIYSQSPKVIHTKPRDFMALVQRLTGMANSKVVEASCATATMVQRHLPRLEASENFESSLSDGSKSSIKQQEEQQWKHGTWPGNDETSSALKDGRTFVKEEPSAQHSCFNIDLSDMPLFTFTPNSSDFVYSSRSVHKYSDSFYGILGSLLSPSGLEFMKELPEY